MATKQTEATERYRRANVKQVIVRFYPSEADLLEHLDKQASRAGYIKELIRADMTR